MPTNAIPTAQSNSFNATKPARWQAMMRAVRGWFGGLFSRRDNDPFACGLDDFIDIERLNRHFDTRRTAWEDGRDNLPAPQEQIETSFQHRVTYAGAEALGRLRKNVAAWVKSNVSEKAHRLLSRPPAQQFHQLAETADRETLELCRDWGPKLADLARLERLSVRELLYFRKLNGIRRETPQQAKPLWVSFGVVMALGMFESLINGLLLAQVDEGGLAGGWLKAAMLAFINIGIGLAAGYWLLRNAIHVNPRRRWSARIAAVAVLFTLLLMHVVIAVWRSLLEHSIEINADHYPPISDAAQALFHGDVAIGSLESFFLLFIGLMAAVIATVDGFQWLSDPYPGFSRVYGAWQQAQIAYEQTLQRFKQAILQPTEQAETRMREMRSATERLSDSYDTAIHRARDLAHQIRAAVSSVCVTYREENAKLRTAPFPLWMDLVPELPFEGEIDESLLGTADQLAAFLADVDDLLVVTTEEMRQRVGLRLQWMEEDFLPYVEGIATPLADISEQLLRNADINEKAIHERDAIMSRSNPRFTPPPTPTEAPTSNVGTNPFAQPLH